MSIVDVGRMLAVASLSGVAWISTTSCHAQSYPTRTIRIIVALAPGGGTDLVARVVSQKLSEQLGVSIIVDNRAGGGTVIGTELLSRAAPDGYTLSVASAEISINPSLRKLPYDTIKDFTCITQLTSGQFFLSTHPSVPVKTIQQLVTLAKSRPAQITFGSSGPGSANHLAGMWLQQLTSTKLVHIPYKGGGLANAALQGGEIDFMFSNTASVIPQLKSGRLRAIASTGSHRSPVAPAVPTIAESGIPQFVVTGFYLLLAPAETPRAIVSRLNLESRRALEAAAVKVRLAEFGAEPVGSSPEACADLIQAEISKWAPVVKASGAAAD